MQFSLSFFSSEDSIHQDSKYAFLIECSDFADQNNFTAIWTPERHFHTFGGIFPNPSLMGVLLATRTSNVRIRAGSIVSSLHHPIRIAEEWSVVDNLSQGRVDLSFTTGWNPNDFILAPENHSKRSEVTFSNIDTIQRLWQGEEYTGPNGEGEISSVRIHPLPVQKKLPVWLTCADSADRFVQAGSKGFNVLTAFILMSEKDLIERIKMYREAREKSGFDPTTGKVTLMLHTFVGNDMSEVRDIVREPMKSYLKSSVDLWRQKNRALEKLRNREDALEFAFERYFRTSGLFGTVETCTERVIELQKIGVGEIACLIDYGVGHAHIKENLVKLNLLREKFQNH